MKMNQKAEFTNKVIIQERPHTCVLTISLLVSNHIDTISKCMKSIQPLLEQISSELIVVDTVGPDQSDGSLAVAEKYADKIIHFDWCDDFSAARNAGLKCANGEWFLFLDDDEWFDDVSELVNFFKDEMHVKIIIHYIIHSETTLAVMEKSTKMSVFTAAQEYLSIPHFSTECMKP